jgi:hypothetical protein
MKGIATQHSALGRDSRRWLRPERRTEHARPGFLSRPRDVGRRRSDRQAEATNLALDLGGARNAGEGEMNSTPTTEPAAA